MAILRYPIFAKNGDTVALEAIYSGSSFRFGTQSIASDRPRSGVAGNDFPAVF